MAKGDLSAAFVIPKGFSAAVTSGHSRPITVLASVDSAIAEQVARSLAESFTAQIEAVQLSVESAVGAGAPHPRPDSSQPRPRLYGSPSRR